MPNTDHVQVQITVDSVGITRQGFGMPLIVSHCAEFGPERVRFYSSIAAVAEDFETDSVEYRCATRIFSQSPKPPRIAIGRADAAVSQQYEISVSDVRNSTAYALKIKGVGFEDATATTTSDTDATADEIIAALLTQVNAVTDKNFTASVLTNGSDDDTLQITADEDCGWFSVEVVNPRLMSSKLTHTVDNGDLTEDLDEMLLEDGSWYCVLTNYNSQDYVGAVADWVNANGRIYSFDVPDTESIDVAVGSGTDTLAVQFGLGYSGVQGSYHPNPAAFMAAGWMGAWLPTDPGQATSKFITIQGVEPVRLTDTAKNNLRARRANSYERVYNIPITWEGTVFSTEYKFLDVRRDVDWLIDYVQTSVFGLLAGSPIIPYTPPGLAKIEGVVRSAIDGAAVTQGVLAEGTTVIEMPVFADIDPADKADRILRHVKFFGTLSGAVHAVIPIDGVVTF